MFFYFELLAWYLFMAASLVQLSVWIGVLGRLAYGSVLKPQKVKTDDHKIAFPVSVIVCARNERENLKMLLPLLFQQVYSEVWEIIMVDDASSDGSMEWWLSVRHQFQSVSLKWVRIENKVSSGKKEALAKGVAAAGYENILLTDADCRPASPYWIVGMMEAMHRNPQTEIVLGYGPMEYHPSFVGAWARFETAHTAIQYAALASLGLPYMGVGRNLAWKKSAYNRVGGFDTHVHIPSGDDDLLVNAVATPHNVSLWFEPRGFVFSKSKDSWAGWIAQKQRHLLAGKVYQWKHKLPLTAFAGSYPVHYFFGLVLIFFSETYWSEALFIYLFRLFLVWILTSIIHYRLQEKQLWLYFPLFDGFLAIYYGAFVPLTYMGRRRGEW